MNKLNAIISLLFVLFILIRILKGKSSGRGILNAIFRFLGGIIRFFLGLITDLFNALANLLRQRR